MSWPVHAAAELFPLLDDDQLTKLAEDIAAHGLHESIWLWDDEEAGSTVLLDGRNRLAACDLVGVEPTTLMYEGDDPIGFVLSQNLHRRHLTTGQRASIAAALVPLYADEASKRMKAGVADPSKKSSEGSKSTEQAGEQVGVSSWAVESYRRVERQAPDLAEQVKNGKITLGSAVEVVKGKTEKAKPGKSTRVERSYQIQELAGKGYRAAQIAEEIGVGVEYVRVIATDFDITLPDAAIGKTRHIDSHRIIFETVTGLEGTRLALDLIDWENLVLDSAEVEYWVASLNDSLAALRKLAKHLKGGNP